MANNYEYAIFTRMYNVPKGYDGSLLCRRVEQEYMVGPLDLNREAILRMTTDLKTDRTIFTDSNGYQMMKRQYKNYSYNTLARVSTLNYVPFVFRVKLTKTWNLYNLEKTKTELLDFVHCFAWK